ncbi:caspase family protein [Variovorax sp. J22R115]|uniref:caspase family protein n=1 Tax=Variovorax sp. J22R115 TaxID=3053509 RepID=UPI0025770451|nr:caspase family protein [Variovorax sp. J22R115]MDM0053031.1 caspase family protein [Variovorax sp. J22R115]
MHHTWKPERKDFRGHETIVSMWRFHTQENHWSDIAQHITIDPNGEIWLGRNWNNAPASASGFNGNSAVGPFMFEMIGNFDKDCDPFDGAQRDAVISVIAAIQERFDLQTRSLKFHNSMSPKSCPGSSLDYEEIVSRVEAARHAVAAAPKTRGSAASKRPFPDEPDLALAELVKGASRTALAVAEPGDAELSHHEHGLEALDSATGGAPGEAAARDSGLSAGQVATMRPHLINLRSGRFSDEGEVSTTSTDVDAIFESHLPSALAAAKAAGRKLKLLIYLHGGLVSESSGLQVAFKHIDWWMKNDVYPIYFIWETGLFETIGQLLTRARQPGARDVFDFTTDPVIEATARALQGPRIWGGMKSSAEHAVDPPSPNGQINGGAHYAATKLKTFCDSDPGAIELHAVGHSAGSIFLAYFVATAHALGVPSFKTGSFLAPAIRVDTFKDKLLNAIGPGKGIDKLYIFTMKRDFERGDNCAGTYRKSLLYLIYYALEDRRKTPILGLEESLRGDKDLKKLCGLDGGVADGEVVWAVTQGDTGRSASTSTSHGGFDDDAPTMNSVLRRVLAKDDADTIVDYGGSRDLGAGRPWIQEYDLPPELAALRAPEAIAMTSPGVQAMGSQGSLFALSAGTHRPASGASRRMALCVGIDRYPGPYALAGCVADANAWAGALKTLGFETSMLTNEGATRAAIDRNLRALINGCRAGDVIVFQYAGHGTFMPDLDGDEEDGNDEAICPVDFGSGALYIDDDISKVLATLPEGVNLTIFMDCCHSGTNTRFAMGAPQRGAAGDLDERRRFIVPTPEVIQAHIEFRKGLSDEAGTRAVGGKRMRVVKFAACQDHEVAWESQGHGEFTVRATRVLAQGIDAMTNQQFVERVITGFGANPRQHPMLDGAKDTGAWGLLLPRGASAAKTSRQGGEPAAVGDEDLLRTIAALGEAVTTLASRQAAP